MLLVYAIYRSSYAALFGYDRFDTLGTVGALLQSPLPQLLGILQISLRDLVYVIVTQWQSALVPSLIDLSRPFTYLLLGSMTAFGALAYLVLTWRTRHAKGSDEIADPLRVCAAGLLIIILSMLPFWFTGFSIYEKNQLWSERLALAAMPGAAMLIVGAAYAIVDRTAPRNLLLSVLLGLGIGMHVQTAHSFQASWDKQRAFYWQLYWRAPSLQANTMLVADQEILFYMGIYPTAFAINLLYPQITPAAGGKLLVQRGLRTHELRQLRLRRIGFFEKYGATFRADVTKVVSITFEPGLDQCLWVLRPELANAPGLTPTAQAWLGVSNPARIQLSTTTGPPVAIFGHEPDHTWCYYYEKADLARQYLDWDGAISLWHQSEDGGVRAANGAELLPFIEALARKGSWQEAGHLTHQAEVLPDRSTSLLCDLWRQLGDTTTASTERDQMIEQVNGDLGCQL